MTDTDNQRRLDLDAVGRTSEPHERSWTAADARIYALGVGAGLEDPAAELAFTTENCAGVDQQVLPTFAVVLGMSGLPPIGKVRLSQILHGDQSLTLHQTLPTTGRARVETTVQSIHDKGSGALVTTRTELVDADTGAPLATISSGIFVRGEGGFGGDRGTTAEWSRPDRDADETVSYTTGQGQALIYRLSGDTNPLHSDPQAAAAVGFPRPILHGLCTYGFTGRALLSRLCDGDPAQFGSMQARFSKPVLPGQRLDVSIWRTQHGALFQTSTPEGGVVLDQGRFDLR